MKTCEIFKIFCTSLRIYIPDCLLLFLKIDEILKNRGSSLLLMADLLQLFHCSDILRALPSSLNKFLKCIFYCCGRIAGNWVWIYLVFEVDWNCATLKNFVHSSVCFLENVFCTRMFLLGKNNARVEILRVVNFTIFLPLSMSAFRQRVFRQRADNCYPSIRRE